MLLEGRCYEREAVPYKTLDGIVDALSRRFSRLTANEVAALLPARSASLGQVFPVMLRVQQVAKEHASMTVAADPYDLRQRAFAALRELLIRIAERRPTIIAIDDLQWADEDGLRALAEILRPPDPPSLLFVGTFRVAAAGESPALAKLRAALPGNVRVIALEKLAHAETRQLAETILRRVDNPDADSDRIAREANGHPLFVEELARHLATSGSHAEVRLDDAIRSRVARFDAKTREMAELVAIAGKPLPQEVVATAAHVEPGEFHRRAATLRASNIARTGGTRWADAIEPYHDRVREAVLAQLEPERRRALHEALATAFEASPPTDAETLATHWREAGNIARALQYATKAGDQAARSFAFDRAAQWYEEALGLLPAHTEERRALHVKLGDALANAGRGAFAAPHFESAAEASSPNEALALRWRAADQLIRCGNLDRGRAVARGVLAAVGVRVPTTLPGAIVALLWSRFILTLRGLRFRERDPRQLTAQQVTRLDALLSLGISFAVIDPVIGVVLSTRALVRALSAGDIERIVRAMAMVGGSSAAEGGRAWRRAQGLFLRAAGLAEKSGSLPSRVFATSLAGIGLYLNGRFRDAAENLRRTLELLQDGSTGLVQERVSSHLFLIRTLTLLGEFKEHRRHQEDGLRDAIRRGDTYGAVNMRVGFMSYAYLAADRPDLASGHLDAALAEWTEHGFTVIHSEAGSARGCIARYRGDARTAYAAAIENWRQSRRSFLWRVQLIRVMASHEAVMASLAMLRQGFGRTGDLLRTVEGALKGIERESLSWALPLAQSGRAGIALHKGSRDEALSLLDAAVRGFEAHDMRGYAAAGRYHAAGLRGDNAEKRRALDYFAREDVVRPEQMIGALIEPFSEA
jgi:tetratricopeptide (TPR) repeat protein